MATALAVLPERERNLKAQLEHRIAAAVADGRRCHFVVGECLDAILDLKLYRDSHSSFEDYCVGEWGFSGQVGRRAADSYRVSKTLSVAEESNPEAYWSILTGLQPSHAEQLKRLPEDVQPIAWQEARQTTTTPTVKALEEVVARHRDRLEKLPNMTAAEESEFNASVESETAEAYQNGRFQEVALLVAKKIRAGLNQIPLSMKAKFAGPIRSAEAVAKEFERLGS